jgi:hypothetical protein
MKVFNISISWWKYPFVLFITLSTIRRQ